MPPRTPTPSPTSASSGGGGGGGSNATAVPSSTPIHTATPAPLITIAYTPVGGIMPTAGPCSSHPTLQAQNLTNIRSGPGVDYPAVGELVYLEVRPIIGRATDVAWWLIILDNGVTGWVADAVVIVEGYTDIVPIIPAPLLNGATATAGVPWKPTPPLFCTVTPTATPTATATATATATVPAPTTAIASESSPPPPTATALPQPTQTAVSPPTLIPTTPPRNDDGIPVTDPPNKDLTALLLPASGILLLIVGGIALLKQRQPKR